MFDFCDVLKGICPLSFYKLCVHVPVIETKFEIKATSPDLQNPQLVTSRGKAHGLRGKVLQTTHREKTKQQLVRYNIVLLRRITY